MRRAYIQGGGYDIAVPNRVFFGQFGGEMPTFSGPSGMTFPGSQPPVGDGITSYGNPQSGHGTWQGGAAWVAPADTFIKTIFGGGNNSPFNQVASALGSLF